MTKSITLIASMILLSLNAFSQAITNGGFETWTGTPSHPAGWCDPESLAGLSLGLLSKDATASGHLEGSFAVKLKTDSAQTPFGTLLLNGFLSWGSGRFNASAADPSQALDYFGQPFAYRPDSIQFSYKYAPVANDQAEAAVYLIGNGLDIGGNSFYLAGTSGNWLTETYEIPYANNNTPDTIFVFFNSSGENTAAKNSTLWIDAVSFIYNNPSSDVDDIPSTLQVSVGPNPSSAVLTFYGDKSFSGSRIQVYNLKGEELLNRILDDAKLDVTALPAGSYLFMLNHKDGSADHGRFSVLK